MLIIAACFLLFLWFLWCIAMIGTHLQWLSEWKARPKHEREPHGRYVKPKWSDTWDAMKLGLGLIIAGVMMIVGFIFGI